MSKDSVRWGRFAAFYGVLGGVAIAVALPYIVLVYGKDLGAGVHAIIILLALLVGGTVTVISAFFAVVIPREIKESPDSADTKKPPEENTT